MRPDPPQVEQGPLGHLVTLSASVAELDAVAKLLAALDLKSLPDDDCVVTVTDEEQKAMSFNLIDCFPTDFVIPELSAGAKSNLGELHVKVHRVELA